MLIGFTSEQSRLRDATRDLMAGVSSEARVRALMPDPAGGDPDAWRELAGLGLPGIAIPERFGGDGGSLVDQGVVLEEMGRALAAARTSARRSWPPRPCSPPRTATRSPPNCWNGSARVA